MSKGSLKKTHPYLVLHKDGSVSSDVKNFIQSTQGQTRLRKVKKLRQSNRTQRLNK